MSLARTFQIAVLTLLGAVGARAADSPPVAAGPKASPFMPPANAATAPTAVDSGETLEFAGISSVGSRTDYIVHDRTAKKSHWLGMGETKNGIALVSHDARRDVLTISANGVQKQLPLRKAAASGNRPPVAPLVTVSQSTNPSSTDSSVISPPPSLPQPPSPQPVTSAQTEPRPAPSQETIVKQETEARMLVSDLLEIGMAQRRAYEEAQRRSASGNQSDAQPEAPKQP
jgi:hypothetical protein